jgi:HAD domain in Swiss Army Knife RNA repair proteins
MSVVKVVYLDFDGVLHPTSAAMDGLLSRAHLLEPLFENNIASIVISSSWRFTHSLDALKAKLPSSLAKWVVDVTGPALIGKYARYQEILAHAFPSDEIMMWRALDDSYWEFPSNCPELIRCNPNTGIANKQIVELRQWLEGS